jgi:hypothetical protein
LGSSLRRLLAVEDTFSPQPASVNNPQCRQLRSLSEGRVFQCDIYSADKKRIPVVMENVANKYVQFHFMMPDRGIESLVIPDRF